MPPHDQTDRETRLRHAIDLKRQARSDKRGSLPPRPADAEPRLGEMQQSLWLSHEMNPTSAAYNLVSGFRVSGPLDATALQSSLDAVVARHRLLRSTFRPQPGGVAQRVQAEMRISLELLEAGAGQGLGVATAEARRPFDLRAGPLIRLLLVEESSTAERLLVLVMHHILADERSLGLLWEQLANSYSGHQPGPPPSRQYDDYVHWETGRGDVRERDLVYWRRRLDPLPENVILPFERDAGGTSTGHGRYRSVRLARHLPPCVRRLASQAGTTPFMVYAFVFRLLLARYGVSQNAAFATPVSTRSHPAVAEMLGYFLNPVVVRAAVDESRAVGESVREFARETREDLAHASLPFDALAAELSPIRQPGRHPIFQVMFVYQETPPPPSFGDTRLDPVAIDLGDSKFDLTLFVSEFQGAVELGIEYRADRFAELWIQPLLGHYVTLVEAVSDAGARVVADCPMLTPEESAALAGWRSAPARATGMTTMVPDQIQARIREAPESCAVVCAGQRWSYSDLDRHARVTAGRLRRTGVEPGARVALYLDRSPAMMAGVLGCHWAGMAYVPLDPSYPPARNRALLEDADVAAVLTTTARRDQIPDDWLTICLDQPGDEAPDAPGDVGPDDTAYILYTSGSTGHPKGVCVTHDNLRASTDARRDTYDRLPDRFLLLPSLAFDSSVAGIFWTLSSGGSLVLPTDDDLSDPRQLASLVADEGVTTLLCVPSLYASMLRLGPANLEGLATAIVAGERCPVELVREHFRRLPHVRLFNEYGPTEGTVWATVHEVTASETGPVPIGRPIAGVSIHVLDPRGRPVPAGVPGEAWIEGPTVAAGYWRRPDLTDERFVPDGASHGQTERRYRTGDRVSWRLDGKLIFLGREDDQIKLRGFRIEPGEVERGLLRQPDVREAAVVTAPSAQLVAYVETEASCPAERRREQLRQFLPEFMVPERYVELTTLPRLPNGKVDRTALERLAAEIRPDGRRRAAETELEQELVALWEGLLGRSGIGVTDNFFESGGHSLLVVEMVDSIERDYGVPLLAADVFETPTVRELAARIHNGSDIRQGRYSHLFPLQPGGRATPLIVAIPHFFSEMFVSTYRGIRPVYGLRGVGVRSEGNAGRWRTMTDLAEELVAEIRLRFPEGPYVMAGYSFGASMAFEAVRLMEARGIEVTRLFMIAPMALDYCQVGPVRLQLDGLRVPAADLTVAGALRLLARQSHPLTAAPYRRAWQQLAVRPWRRILSLVGRIYRANGMPLTSALLHADVRAERFRLHRGFRPGVITTPTVIFNPIEAETDAAATWSRSFAGPVTVCPIPDPHDGDASVEAARAVILEALDRLDADPGGKGRAR